MASELTVIVVALLGGEALDLCVRGVGAQCATVLVVERGGSIADTNGRAVGMAERLDIPAKRRSAVELATTPLVALIEDIVLPAPGWAEAITAAFLDERVVACGGPVRAAAGLPPQTQALILSEYGRYNDRIPTGEVAALPGCNFAFRREALMEAMRGLEGLVDLPVFQQLEQTGQLVWAPGMAVTFSHPYPEGARLKTRFGHGRIYASSKPGLANRAATAAKAFLLPAIMTVRSLKNAGSAKPSTLAWLALQHSAWAAGEFVGAVLGPGKGLRGWQ